MTWNTSEQRKLNGFFVFDGPTLTSKIQNSLKICKIENRLFAMVSQPIIEKKKFQTLTLYEIHKNASDDGTSNKIPNCCSLVLQDYFAKFIDDCISE